MTEETSPDWLPAGWSLEFKFQKTGRRITHYINLETGQKFFTKDDLICYTKSGSTQCDDQQPTLRQIKMRSANDHVNTATKANERPEWLPKDWFMELKTCKSGAKIGRHYKIYIDPSTGFRFYSKPEVFKFLNNVEQESSKSEPKKRASHSTSKTAVKGNEHPEWLPQNWFMEVKTHKSGTSIGKHFKVYVDPSTGFRFHSKPDVFRFLNHTEQKSSKPKQKKRASGSTSKVVIKNSKDDLPAGWIKEVKTRRNAYGIRRDPYYTDPASGYVFRSKKAVLRYLETGEIGRDAFLPKNNHSDDQNLINNDKSQLPAAKRQKVKHPATRRQLFTGGETSDRSILSDLEAGTFQKGQSKKDYTETRLATASVLQIPQRKGSVENAIKRNPETAEKSSRSSSVAPKASKRKQGKIVSTDNMLVSTAATDVLQVKNLLESGTEKRSNINFKNSSKSKNKKELALPSRFSNRLARFEPQLAASGLELAKPCKNETNGPCVLEDEAPQQLNNIRPNEDRAILGEQPQMLGTQKGCDSKSELQPFFCSDPCLEFAIKTLTGAIPLEDAINEGFVSPPIANIQQQKNLAETRIEHSSCRKTSFNSIRSKNKDGSLHHRSSKRLAGHAPELVASLSNERVVKVAAIKSCNSKAIQNADRTSANLTDKASQELEIGPRMALEHHDFTYRTTVFHVESTNNSKEPHQNQTVPTEMIEKPGLQSAIPFGNSWSDPCFGFAFKTVTGSSPAEDSFTFQSHFNQQFGSSGTQRDGNFALPDNGFPNVFQSGISSHLDAMAQPVMQQQFPVNPSFLPPGNVNLPSCSRDCGQQPYRKGKRNYQAR